MKKRIYLILIALFITVIYVSITYSLNVNKHHNYTFNEKVILEKIESSYNKYNFNSDYVDRINEYLNFKNKDSSFYFIKGYLDYIHEDYESAIYNFKQSKKYLNISSPEFITVYTPFF